MKLGIQVGLGHGHIVLDGGWLVGWLGFNGTFNTE